MTAVEFERPEGEYMMDAGNEKVALRSRIAELEVENALLRQREKERLKASQQELRLDQLLRNLGPDFQENIASLVKLCGDFLGGACSFYNRLRGDKLTPCGQWNIPPGFNPGVGLMARLCRDLIHGGEEKFLYIPCLDDIPCTETEFDNHGAGFKTFLGCVVGYGNTSVGALCVLYRKHYILTEQDQRIMTIIATVIADEDRRNEAAKALRESEERFRGLVNGTHDIVYAINADGCCTFIGPQVSRYGFTPDELLGRNFLDLILAEDRELLEADFKKTRNLSQSYSQMVFRKILRDGRIVWLENTGTSLYDDAGRFTFEIGNLRDITERKLMEEALRQAEEERLGMERRLQHSQRLESLGILAGGIAHDFNNLLMSIMGNLEMAKLEIAPFSKAQSYLDASMSSSLRAADITRQMLSYSGKGRFLIREVDLDSLIKGMLSLLESSLSKTAILRLDLCRSLPAIMADAGQIQQIIMNLAINASEAIGEETGVITLKTCVMSCDDVFLCQSCLEEKPQAGRFVVVEVTDTGCGMDKETRNRLFDPFFTTRFVGRGLGMSAVLGIVRGHEGAIMVDSEPMKGTVVQVLFPLRESVEDSGREES